VLFQNKINLRYCASGWFYYRNILRCTVLQTSKNTNSYFCPEAATVNAQNRVIIETKYQQFLIPQRTDENQMCRLGKPFL